MLWASAFIVFGPHLHIHPLLASACPPLPPPPDSLRRECEELKRKLEDSKKQLQGNEQMIRWLNSQASACC